MQVSCSIFEHNNIVNCLDVDGKTLVTGSFDTSIRIWDYGESGRSSFLLGSKKGDELRIKQSFFGHDEKITCVALSTDYGIVVSGCYLQSVLLGWKVYADIVSNKLFYSL